MVEVVVLWLMSVFAVIIKYMKILEGVALGKARMALMDREGLVQKLSTKALKRENGTAIARLGPNIQYLHSNLAMVVPKTTQQLSNLVQAIESQANGRKILKPLADMVDHNTMANMTVKDGAMTQRKLLVPFTSDVRGFLSIGREMMEVALQEWSKQKDGIILLDEVKYLVRAMSAKRVLGAELTRADNSIIEDTLIAVKSQTTRALPLSTASFQQTKNRYGLFSKKMVDTISEQIIHGVESQSHKENFFSEIIKNMTDYKNTQQISRDYIYDPLVTSAVLVVATLDGIYTNLTAILLQLIAHPEVYRKLYDECYAASVDGESISDEMIKDKNALPYLHYVYMEGLRFNSSLPILARYTEEGIHTDETDIPAHSNILINLKAMHFDKSKWGEDAEEFIPERFLRHELRDIQMGKAPFIPFSLGQRQCPGIKVGETIIKLWLTQIILNYQLCAAPNQPAPRVDEISLAPDPGPGYKVIFNTLEKGIKPCNEQPHTRVLSYGMI